MAATACQKVNPKARTPRSPTATVANSQLGDDPRPEELDRAAVALASAV